MATGAVHLEMHQAKNEDSLQNHFFSTYVTLRKGMSVLAIAFPPMLWIFGMVKGFPCLQDSMSAYYHANEQTRVVFVGLLFAIGSALYLYKGYTRKENIALNMAGVLALGVAYFPMEWVPKYHQCALVVAEKGSDFSISPHGVCAILFFSCIAYVCWARAKDTLGLVADLPRRKKYRRDYKICAVLLVAAPLIAYVFTAAFQNKYSFTFFVEAIGVYAFAWYWWRKTDELAETKAEFQAAHGTSAELQSVWQQNGKTE